MTTETKTICTNKATGEIIGHSDITSPQELKSIITTSRSAFNGWSNTPLKTRKAHLLKVRDYLVKHAEEIAELISQENGKTRVFALTSEVFACTLAINYFIKNSRKFLVDTPLASSSMLLLNKRSYIQRVPYGVIGIISPWNYPLTIPITEVIKALLAGNTVILKTATETQMVGRFIEKALESAGLPDGVFTYINMKGNDASDGLLNGNVDKLVFTGSVKVGKHIMEKAAKTLTPVVLELGGNDAMIICEDANLNRAVKGAFWGGFSNCGQTCGGVERVYAHEKIYDKFLMGLSEKINQMSVGHETNFDKDMGVMTTERQIDTVNVHIEDALSKGARIMAQSKTDNREGIYNSIPATLLVDVDHSMKVMQEETFGPVIAVMNYQSDDEAIAMANDSDLGLTGSVWSKNKTRAERIARQINAGAVNINDHMMSHGMAETPWGGFKNSGIGRTHGKSGFDEMTQTKVIVRDILPFAGRNLWWQPYDKKSFNGFLGGLKLSFGKSIKDRISGLFAITRIMNRYYTDK